MSDRELEQIASMPRAFLDGLGVGLSLVDARTGRFLFVNQECCRILGFAEAQLTDGKITFRDLTHPEDRKRNDAEQHRLLTGEVSSYRIDKRYQSAEGNIVWADVTVRGLRDSKGALRWCSAAIVDITESKLVERQLIAARDVGGLSTWNFSVKTNSSDISGGYNALFGASAVGPAPSLETLLARVHPDDRDAVASVVRKAITSGTGYVQEYRIVDESGRVRWLRGLATCIYDVAGNVTNLIGATVDITSRKDSCLQAVPSKMRNVLRYIEENWSKPLNVEEIATRNGVSNRSLYRFFKARGSTVSDHIRRLRLQHARRMLIEAKPGVTVTGISLKCGFANHGHFSKHYYAEFGELPSDTLRGGK